MDWDSSSNTPEEMKSKTKRKPKKKSKKKPRKPRKQDEDEEDEIIFYQVDKKKMNLLKKW